MTALSFITDRFGGIQRGRNFRADCPECGKKSTLSWSMQHPHAFKCFSCNYAGNVFNLGYRDENAPKADGDKLPPELDPLTIEGFKARRRRKGTLAKEPRHRLSDRVVAEFGLKVRQATGSNGRPQFQVPFTNADGETVKYLTTYMKSWLSPKAKYKPKDFWLNTHRLAGNKTKTNIFILAGEWDLMAFWERTGIHGISPANGEMSRPPIEETDLFAGKTVIFLYDNDASGRRGSKQVASFILRHQKNVRIKSLNLATLGCPAGEDIDWYFANGGTWPALLDHIRTTPDITDSTPEDVFRLIKTLPERGIPLPNHPVSELPRETLEVIWRAGALPENQKNRVFEQLALEEGIRPDQARRIAARMKYFTNELNVLIFYAFDDYLGRAFRDSHIKAQVADNRIYDRSYYYYQHGVYRAVTDDDRRRMVDNIARMICAADNRMYLSRVRKQLDEDLTNRMDNLAEYRFDEDTNIINFRNGLYDLKEGLIRAHTPEHLSTFQLGIEYQQNAPCPWFMQALETWFEDQSVRNEFLKVCYYAISGNRGAHIAAFFYGEGGDGKGEAVKILKALVGDDRTSAISLEDLDNQFMPAGLFGKWLNIADEVGRKSHLNDAQFKRVTGGSTMTADVKWGQPITFVPKAFWVVLMNSVFSSSDNSRGFNRRLKFIIFRQVPADKKIDNFFHSHLRGELSGIAEYILTEGKRLYEAEGFRETEAELEIKEDLMRGHSVNAFWQDVFTGYTEGASEGVIARSVPSGKFEGWSYIDPHQFFDRYKEHCKEVGSSASNYSNFVRDSRNIIEKLLNNSDVARGRGEKQVRVQRAKIRISIDMHKTARPTRVMLVNQDVTKLLKKPDESPETHEPGAKVDFAGLWADSGPISH